MPTLRCARFFSLLPLLLLSLAGCAGPGPRLAADVPTPAPDSRPPALRAFDDDRDGHVDYVESLGANGVVAQLRADIDRDGTLESLRVPGVGPARRHLVLILDSIPYHTAAQAWQSGRFRLFHPPTRVLSPFPVMTDPCLADFFHVLPVPGVESMYFDGVKLTDALATYEAGGNAPWLAQIDYFLPDDQHGNAYVAPRDWFAHELRAIQDRLDAADQPLFVAYCVGTSALGIQEGRRGQDFALRMVDRLCRWLVQHYASDIDITIFSDHGQNYIPARRVRLGHELAARGFRDALTLRDERDVVIPEWGLVNCVAVHTRAPAAVAAALATVPAVDLAFYRTSADTIVVVDATGRAEITRRIGDAGDECFAYRADTGDPLRLADALAHLHAKAQLDDAGYATADAWLAATAEHAYPDVPRRVWRAFNGLFDHPPDVFVSLKVGWCSGSSLLAVFLDPAASHGALTRDSAYGFAMSTRPGLPPIVRMEDLRAALIRVGVPFTPDSTPAAAELP